jgi:hypothetical protein
MSGQPTASHDLELRIDYHAFFIYDEAHQDDPASDTAERANEDADSSAMQVGQADKLIAVMTPVQFNYTAPLRVEVWAAEPPADIENWDHVVDIDLDAPTGHLMFRESGPADDPVPCKVESGTYRARVAERGWDITDMQGGGLDDYRVQLWPRTGDAEPRLIKAWPGWAKLLG